MALDREIKCVNTGGVLNKGSSLFAKEVNMEYFIVGLLCFIIGFLLGGVILKKVGRIPVFGELRIDTSAEDKDVYRLNLTNVSLDDLQKYNSVILKVINDGR